MIANLLEVGRLAPGPSLRTWRLVLFLHRVCGFVDPLLRPRFAAGDS